MANRTQKDAKSIKGTNPQYLVEKIIRTRIYDCKYWKEECFGLSSELLVDKAMELESVGGVYGANVQPSNFLCLLLKMLQIQPSKDIIIEFIKNPDYKYVRVLGALYLRLVGTSLEVYNYLEPLYNDYRKLKVMDRNGELRLSHVDEFVDTLLHQDRCCDTILPRIQKRHVLEQTEQLEPRVSALDEDLEADEEEEEEEEEEEDEDSPPHHRRSPSPYRDKGRHRSHSRSPHHRSRSRSPVRRRRSYSRSPRRHRHRSPSPRRHTRRHSRSPSPYHRERGGGRVERGRDRDRGRERDYDRERERDREREKEREDRSKEKERDRRDKERERGEKKSSKEEAKSGKEKKKKKKKDKDGSTKESKEDEEIREQNELRAKLGIKPLRVD